MKNIMIIALGGTISAEGINQMDNISSTNINSTHWIALRNKIDHYFNLENYDGIVITHGTNTLEETAYFLHLTVPSKKPVVITGSQRPFSALSSDAHLNLIDAVRVAATNESYGKGVLVVANNKISSARDVTKTNTYQLETFQSGQLGYLGFIDPDHTVQYYNAPTRNHTSKSIFSTITLTKLPAIEIFYSFAGATGELINYITTCGKYDGIVMAGTGAGRFSPKEDAVLFQAVEQGLLIVRSSRVGNGSVVPIAHYKQLKAIHSDNLLPQKARILLMLSLLVYKDVDDIQTVFDHY